MDPASSAPTTYAFIRLQTKYREHGLAGGALGSDDIVKVRSHLEQDPFRESSEEGSIHPRDPVVPSQVR